MKNSVVKAEIEAKAKKASFLLLLIVVVGSVFSCRRNANTADKVVESRTSGHTTIYVDESFSHVLEPQIPVFNSDYPAATIKVVTENEQKIIPKLLKGDIRVAILSRRLKKEELRFYQKQQIGVYTDRFAIDGIALIVNKKSTDTLLKSEEIFDIMRGKSTRKLVFDNAYSSTIQYFLDSAKIEALPKAGVYTLNNNKDVIAYVGRHPDYIGVVGVNWLLQEGVTTSNGSAVKEIAVANSKKSDTKYYKPTQDNLISGQYPFLRNIYIINCEGRDGLGTGFANWLTSQRGQLIVLKSGLGPHKLLPRELNYKTTD